MIRFVKARLTQSAFQLGNIEDGQQMLYLIFFQNHLTQSLDVRGPLGGLFRYALDLLMDRFGPDMHELTCKQLYGRQ